MIKIRTILQLNEAPKIEQNIENNKISRSEANYKS
jgi:hypothetical protein